MTVPVRS